MYGTAVEHFRRMGPPSLPAYDVGRIPACLMIILIIYLGGLICYMFFQRPFMYYIFFCKRRRDRSNNAYVEDLSKICSRKVYAKSRRRVPCPTENKLFFFSLYAITHPPTGLEETLFFIQTYFDRSPPHHSHLLSPASLALPPPEPRRRYPKRRTLPCPRTARRPPSAPCVR